MELIIAMRLRQRYKRVADHFFSRDRGVYDYVNAAVWCEGAISRITARYGADASVLAGNVVGFPIFMGPALPPAMVGGAMYAPDFEHDDAEVFADTARVFSEESAASIFESWSGHVDEVEVCVDPGVDVATGDDVDIMSVPIDWGMDDIEIYYGDAICAVSDDDESVDQFTGDVRLDHLPAWRAASVYVDDMHGGVVDSLAVENLSEACADEPTVGDCAQCGVDCGFQADGLHVSADGSYDNCVSDDRDVHGGSGPGMWLGRLMRASVSTMMGAVAPITVVGAFATLVVPVTVAVGLSLVAQRACRRVLDPGDVCEPCGVPRSAVHLCNDKALVVAPDGPTCCHPGDGFANAIVQVVLSALPAWWMKRVAHDQAMRVLGAADMCGAEKSAVLGVPWSVMGPLLIRVYCDADKVRDPVKEFRGGYCWLRLVPSELWLDWVRWQPPFISIELMKVLSGLYKRPCAVAGGTTGVIGHLYPTRQPHGSLDRMYDRHVDVMQARAIVSEGFWHPLRLRDEGRMRDFESAVQVLTSPMPVITHVDVDDWSDYNDGEELVRVWPDYTVDVVVRGVISSLTCVRFDLRHVEVARLWV